MMLVVCGIALGIIIFLWGIYYCRKMHTRRMQRTKVEIHLDTWLLFPDCAPLILMYSGHNKLLLLELLLAKSETLIKRAIKNHIVRKQDVLVAACCNGDVHIVMFLLTQKICVMEDLRNNSMRALRKACKYNQIQIVKYLLDLHVFTHEDLRCAWKITNDNGSIEMCDCYLINIALKHDFFRIAKMLLDTNAFKHYTSPPTL